MHSTADPNSLVQRFRPLYKLHSEEMWYPCHPEDQLRCANLLSVADGSIVIPALRGQDGSVADQLLCTPLGLEQLARRGVHPDAATIADLQDGLPLVVLTKILQLSRAGGFLRDRFTTADLGQTFFY